MSVPKYQRAARTIYYTAQKEMRFPGSGEAVVFAIAADSRELAAALADCQAKAAELGLRVVTTVGHDRSVDGPVEEAIARLVQELLARSVPIVIAPSEAGLGPDGDSVIATIVAARGDAFACVVFADEEARTEEELPRDEPDPSDEEEDEASAAYARAVVGDAPLDHDSLVRFGDWIREGIDRISFMNMVRSREIELVGFDVDGPVFEFADPFTEMNPDDAIRAVEELLHDARQREG